MPGRKSYEQSRGTRSGGKRDRGLTRGQRRKVAVGFKRRVK